jgi:hypothetical protein
LYRLRQAMRESGGLYYQISRHSAHGGGKVVTHTHRSPLPARKYSWYSFLLQYESIHGQIAAGSFVSKNYTTKGFIIYALYFVLLG